MAELLAGLGRRQPQNFVDFADVRPMHRAKRMGTPQVVDGADRRGHPELDMLGIRRPILGMALFAAFFGQRVLDVAQIGAKFHGQARFLADLAYGGMPVRFVRVDLAFRPAPVVVFRAMHDAQFDAVEYVVRCAGCRPAPGPGWKPRPMRRVLPWSRRQNPWCSR